MTNDNLTLQESLLLICLNDRTGKTETSYVSFAINAAALAELLRQRRIAIENGKVVVKNTAFVGDELLDVALSRLATSRRDGKLAAWIGSLYRDKRMPVEVLATRLMRRGILTMQEARLLWVFRQTVFPTRDPAPEQALRRRLHKALFGVGAVDETMATLVALLNACRALQFVVSKVELKKLRPRIGVICASSEIADVVGGTLAAAINETEAAAAAAAVVCSCSS
jgi:hypothetical protein